MKKLIFLIFSLVLLSCNEENENENYPIEITPETVSIADFEFEQYHSNISERKSTTVINNQNEWNYYFEHLDEVNFEECLECSFTGENLTIYEPNFSSFSYIVVQVSFPDCYPYYIESIQEFEDHVKVTSFEDIGIPGNAYCDGASTTWYIKVYKIPHINKPYVVEETNTLSTN